MPVQSLEERTEQGDGGPWGHREGDIGVQADGQCRSVDWRRSEERVVLRQILEDLLTGWRYRRKRKNEAGSSALGLIGWDMVVSLRDAQDGAGGRVGQLGLEFHWDWGCVGCICF